MSTLFLSPIVRVGVTVARIMNNDIDFISLARACHRVLANAEKVCRKIGKCR